MDKHNSNEILRSELEKLLSLTERIRFLRLKARTHIPAGEYDKVGELEREIEKLTAQIRASQQTIMSLQQPLDEDTEGIRLLKRYDAILNNLKGIETELPFSRSYWVIPDTVLAGEIPSSVSEEERRNKLNGLLKSGVNAVINLTEERELNHTGKPLIDYRDELLQLAREESVDMEIYRMSIVDLNIPTPEFMREIINKINELIARDKTVYIHCWGGVGRTGTVVGCFLADRGIVTTNEALEFISYLKANTDIRQRDSPETEEQRQFVQNWAQSTP